jgi:hypothetical protein
MSGWLLYLKYNINISKLWNSSFAWDLIRFLMNIQTKDSKWDF